MRAVLFLQARRTKNRIRQILQRPGLLLFYAAIAAGAGLFFFGATPYSTTGAQGRLWRLPSGESLEAGAAGFALALILFEVYVGAGQAPWLFEEADVYWLFASPIRPQAIVAVHLIRQLLGGFLTATAFAVVAALAAGSAGVSVHGWRFVLVFLAIAAVGWWATAAGSATWLWVVQGGPERWEGRKSRIRTLVTLLAAGILVWTGMPVAGALAAGEPLTASGLEGFAGRLAMLGRWPPFRTVAALLRPVAGGDSSAGAAWEAVAEVAAWTGLAVAGVLLLARGYYEAAEQVATSRASLVQAAQGGAAGDVEALAAELLGIRRARVFVRPFGHGPWALLWAQTVRFLRMEVASLRFSVPFSMIGGAVIGIVARAAGAPIWGVLVVPLLIAVSGSNVYFLEELRRPYLFTIPAPAWKRILAGGTVGWVQGAVSGPCCTR